MKLLAIVKSYFAVVGIDLEIRPMETASFVSHVLTGHKNDQLVQRSASSLGLATEPIRQLERFRTGCRTKLHDGERSCVRCVSSQSNGRGKC